MISERKGRTTGLNLSSMIHNTRHNLRCCGGQLPARIRAIRSLVTLMRRLLFVNGQRRLPEAYEFGGTRGTRGTFCTLGALGTVIALLLMASPDFAAAQRAVRCSARDQIQSVSFAGSPAFDDITLASSIITHEPGLITKLLGTGNKPCFDSLEVQRDGLRLAVLHRQAGWFRATVSPEIQRRKNGVRLRFVIQPGAEAIIDSVDVSGLPDTGLAVSTRKAYAQPLLALRERRFDRPALDSVITSVLDALHDAGYARARPPQLAVAIDSATARVRLAMKFETGDQLRIGGIQIKVEPVPRSEVRTDSSDVVELLDIKSGDLFSSSKLVAAQRNLYRSEAFRLVLVDTFALGGAAGDSLIGLKVSVAEAQSRSARAGIGWATLDCIRVQGRLVNRGFFRIDRKIELALRASKLGVGSPIDQTPALCAPSVRTDPFSQTINYYAGATVSDSRLMGGKLTRVLSVYSERRSEPFAYLRETGIGSLLEFDRQFSQRFAMTTGFQYENGRTDVDPVISCTRFGECQPEEIILSSVGRGIGLASVSGTYDRTNDLVNPSAGWRFRGEERAGITTSEIVSTLKFYRSTIEASGFTRAMKGVLGFRIQSSAVFAPGAQLVDGSPLLPQQERLYVGGQSSVRGFQQNLLGPVVYVVSKVDTVPLADGSFGVEAPQNGSFDRAVPRGGTAMLVANAEYRRGFRFWAEEMQVVTFVDAGALWETSSSRFRFTDLRFTPGVGLRVVTPLGPFRMDVGYRPYEATIGRALYITPAGNGADPLFLCASPRTDPDANYRDVISCPSTFRPREGRTFLSRLVFHFGLGQAF